MKSRKPPTRDAGRRLAGKGLEPLEPRWMLDSTIVLNELSYHPDDSGEFGTEWIELHNQLAVDIDMSGWSLADGVRYQFPEGTVLASGGYLVVAAEPRRTAAVAGATGVLGPSAGRLSNAGERIELRNNSGRVMDAIDYGDRGDWPVGPDGSGATLAKKDSQLSSGPAGNWTTSRQIGGTPGKENFPAFDPTAREQELVALTAAWSYDDSGKDRGTQWREAVFDDGAWTQGPALFYSDNDRPADNELAAPAGLLFLPITGDDDSGIDAAKNLYAHP